MHDYIKDIDNSSVYDVAIVSPLEQALCLSKSSRNHILLKREDLQPVFSFKLRGAYNKIASLSPQQRQAGIITASAGNHAQGVALSGNKLGLHTLIVMPQTTPPIKVSAVQRWGVDIDLFGDTYDQAYDYACGLAEKRGMIFIHPFDDPAIIAGQGTVGKEIHEQFEGPIDAVFVPVGGGGLIAGVAAYLKQKRPETKIIGVEPEDSPTLHHALAENRRVILKQIGLFADGVAVKQIGEETFRVARQTVDEMVLVTTDEICSAIKDHFDDTRSLAEPAGALSIAGLKKYVAQHQVHNKTLVAIVSGSNINFDRLKHIVERYEIGANTESLFSVTIPEQPGSFLKFCRVLGRHTLTEFNYRYMPGPQAHVFVGIKFANAVEEKQLIMKQLSQQGYQILDISDNEMAKLHLRHMIGGSAKLDDEKLLRFEFPERPGALLEFLENVQHDWNISLFHYRNHGAAYGRVLVGVQVPDHEEDKLHEVIAKLHYRCFNESDNPAYRLFLKA